MASLDPGDEVVIPTPYWVSFAGIVEICDGVPIFVSGSGANPMKIGAADLDAAITAKTKWLILNSPSNPGGVGYSAADLADLAAVLRRHPRPAPTSPGASSRGASETLAGRQQGAPLAARVEPSAPLPRSGRGLQRWSRPAPLPRATLSPPLGPHRSQGIRGGGGDGPPKCKGRPNPLSRGLPVKPRLLPRTGARLWTSLAARLGPPFWPQVC